MEPIHVGMSTSAADRFAAVVPRRAGSGAHDNEPRYMEPPASDAAPIRSLSDFERRLRQGVLVVFDSLDHLGRVRERRRGVVSQTRSRGWPHFLVRPTDSTVPMPTNESEAADGDWGAHYPQRSGDCALSGPAITYKPGGHARWRITIIDESNAGPAVERKHQPRHPRPSEATFENLRQHLEYLTERLDPRFRWFTNPRGPMFCWTTETDSDGRYLSFAAKQEGSGSRNGMSSLYELAEDSVSRHQLRRDAKARALRMLKLYQAGNPRPWR